MNIKYLLKISYSVIDKEYFQQFVKKRPSFRYFVLINLRYHNIILLDSSWHNEPH